MLLFYVRHFLLGIYLFFFFFGEFDCQLQLCLWSDRNILVLACVFQPILYTDDIEHRCTDNDNENQGRKKEENKQRTNKQAPRLKWICLRKSTENWIEWAAIWVRCKMKNAWTSIWFIYLNRENEMLFRSNSHGNAKISQDNKNRKMPFYCLIRLLYRDCALHSAKANWRKNVCALFVLFWVRKFLWQTTFSFFICAITEFLEKYTLLHQLSFISDESQAKFIYYYNNWTFRRKNADSFRRISFIILKSWNWSWCHKNVPNEIHNKTLWWGFCVLISKIIIYRSEAPVGEVIETKTSKTKSFLNENVENFQAIKYEFRQLISTKTRKIGTRKRLDRYASTVATK